MPSGLCVLSFLAFMFRLWNDLLYKKKKNQENISVIVCHAENHVSDAYISVFVDDGSMCSLTQFKIIIYKCFGRTASHMYQLKYFDAVPGTNLFYAFSLLTYCTVLSMLCIFLVFLCFEHLKKFCHTISFCSWFIYTFLLKDIFSKEMKMIFPSLGRIAKEYFVYEADSSRLKPPWSKVLRESPLAGMHLSEPVACPAVASR